MSAPRTFEEINNRYLTGNFAPVAEELTVDNLKVIGEIPRELNGLYVRNGPNPQMPPKGSYHWFDGDGMVHGVRLDDGRASYRNRFVTTEGFEREREKGRAIWTGLTGFPNFRQILFPPYGMQAKNVANTALVWHEGRMLALWEVGEPHEISVPGLETIGKLDLGPTVKAFTAHPKVDQHTGEMIFFGMNIGPKPQLQYGIIDRGGQLTHSVDIPLAESVFMHDFAITQHYSIFLDLPYVFKLSEMMLRGNPFKFNENRPARFGLLPRHGQPEEIRWFEAEPCYIFHTLNAYEVLDANGQVEEVVLNASRLKRGTIAAPPGHSTRHAGHTVEVEAQQMTENAARLHEWRMNLKTGQLKEVQLDDRSTDFPQLNLSYTGRQNRYGYLSHVHISQQEATPRFPEIIKHDFETERDLIHNFGTGRYGGEAVFVPREKSVDTNEDDGWLLNYIFDEETETSELVIIDARSMDKEPVARVLLPQRVPYGFHGTWVPDYEF